ncbi:MAR1 ribonuclease [Strigomonas culicis]|uniref:MAR1 ribonuclease n=1 Tax=Strigomonas culicis TaxID=28005 RepID=S9UTA0_9TRYP|nr:MAR1 ribonuclease [Strigomonas culicis]EPY30975.1 MAR1 ribonuclease [Strigomonas culicis]EPY32044.1 MAR1 ribonuclease [Strigomonas culicis]|eukprot:EPY30631.1 MAR1 ribonuclease [Strigomonas culicis]
MSRLLPHYSKGNIAFLCIDLQKAFSDRIANFQNCVFVANQFAAFHEVVPQHTKFIVTEQYPKGLGHTVPEVHVPKSAVVASKTCFTCVTPEVAEALKNYDNVVIFGIEGHVCVLQTAADLLDLKKRVFLPIDGVGSQKKTDLEGAVSLMRTWGPDLVFSSTESILLQMTKDAKDGEFKKIANILKNQHPLPI